MNQPIEPINDTLRTVRRAVGVSLDTMVARTSYSKGYLSNIEASRRAVTPVIAAAYDEALGTGGLLVDLLAADQDGDGVRRRVLLAALGSVAATGVSGPRVMAESLRTSLLSALGGDDWAEIVAEYGRRFMTDSPAMFRTTLAGDLLVLRQSVVDSDSSTVRLAAPRLMTLQGMAIANAGDSGAAARWYRAARLAADRSDDERTRQWVRGRAAFRRGYEGAEPSEVLALASGVDDVEAHLAAAQAYARLDHEREALEALVRARRAHDASDQSETTIYAMPPWRMALSTSYVYALLGDVERCNSELDTVAPPSTVKRWEAQLEIQRAVAYAKAGDRRLGLDVARDAMHGHNEQRSIVVTEMINEIKRSGDPRLKD